MEHKHSRNGSYTHYLLLLSLTLSSALSLLSDVWQRDLVELVLEVSVSQVSHRQRDMLLRQVGVLLGVLDSDIIVREVSAFNEHRSAPFLYVSVSSFQLTQLYWHSELLNCNVSTRTQEYTLYLTYSFLYTF